MHLGKDLETMHLNGVADTDTATPANGNLKSPHQQNLTSNGDAYFNNKVEIEISEEWELDSVLNCLLAGWILHAHRYQRDLFQQCSWGTNGCGTESSRSIQANQFQLSDSTTTADLIAQVRKQRSEEEPIVWSSTTQVYLIDGSEDEWSFRVAVEIISQKLRITSQWQPPNLSGFQASCHLRSFTAILDKLLQGTELPCESLLEISSEELEDIWSWNTPLPQNLERCMHDIISDQAQVQPDKNAVEAWDGNLTYAQVDEYSTQLAKTLQLLDDSEDQIIPVLFEKSRWTIVAVLAVMKAAACFALLDPAQPEGRLRSIVQQTNAKIIVASKAQATLAARVAPGANVFPVSESKFSKLYHPFAEQQPKTTLASVPPSAPLYIQFTSGSTGLPKGCILTHSQYTSGAVPRAITVGYRSHSRVLDFASYAFDVCIDSMLCTLAHGATLCTLSEERRMNDLSGAMRDMKVTLAGMTPSVARTLDPDILPALESLAVGGEGISASDAKSWSQLTTVVNCYGPSECTVGATYNAAVGKKPYISMGKGTGCALWITDPADHNKLVPPGAVGELLIEGPIVGNGYLNNPAKTKEVFIEDPEFLTSGSKSIRGRRGKIYKTGDLVRYDPDGNGEVIFVGRQDQQVKLRGQRIELAEIEYNMQKNLPAGVQLAAEVIKPGGTGEATLVAFMVEEKKNGMRHLDGDIFATFSSKLQQAVQEMLKHLYEDLPSYMVPAAYIPLWKMPLLVSCKTDRKRLREIGTSITRQDLRRFSSAISQGTRPATEMELRLGKLWAKVLGGDADFSGGDNFFSMGGDSLRAMKLVATSREDGIALSVPDIMLNPSLSIMASKAKFLSDNGSTEVPAYSLIPKDWDVEKARVEAAELCGVQVSSVEDVYPCTPLQEGLMALSAKFQDAYVAQRVIELPIAAAEKLVQAFREVAADSPILRTRIINVPGRGLYQVVLIEGQLERDHGSDLEQYLKIDREEPMELGTALFRCGHVQDPGSSKSHIVLTMHHAVYDGWSMPLVFERVNSAFNQEKMSCSVSFKYFINYLSNLDPSVSREYWRERLDGVNPYQFPPLPSKGYITRADSLLEHYVTVPNTAHNKLTLATIIRGAWALVSSLYMGHNDIVFGETLTGRSASVPGIEQIEGPMITTVPIRVQLRLDRPISEYLHSVHAQTVQQIPHEHLGLQNIRRLSRFAKDACDLRTGVVLHPREDGVAEGKSIEIAPADAFLPADDAEAAKEALKFNTYALMLVCTLEENGFLVMASFDSKCISSPVMERVLRVLDRIVTAFLGNPESKLGDLAVLDDNEMKDALALRPEENSVNDMEPVTANGHANGHPPEVVKSSTPNEEKLRNLLSRILGMQVADIDPSDSFFELGGDSISAMRLVSEARLQGLNVTVAQIFQSRSLSELAAAAENHREKTLMNILSRVLSLPNEEVTSNDSFFELGGDSISAMRLVAEARAQGLKITVAQIFQSKSLSELASVAEETSSTVEQVNVDQPFAALGADAHLFSADRIQPFLENPELDIANIYPVRPLQKVAIDGTVTLPRYSLRYELIKFNGAIDRARLQQACQELVNRNEILRTLFVESEGRCLGVVVSDFKAPYTEVSVPEEADVESFVQNFINKDIEAEKPYGSSFVSFTLFTTTSGSLTLAFRISHAQYDEICLPLAFSQLSALYSGTPPPETLPFSKHVNYVASKNIPESTPYWQRLLAGSQMSVFKPDIPITTRKSTSIYREFDISARPKDITIGSLPTAAWAIVLSRLLETRDVVFGEVVTGRNIGVSSADRIIGPTWQYIPFRVPFSPSWTYLDLLRFVQNQHIESSSYEGMGLSEIVKDCTDWDPTNVTWFDSVVHQAPTDWVENMNFGSEEEKVSAKFDTVYPHAEPLREWKCQAFVQEGGKKLGIEIVCFEEWRSVGEKVIGDVGEVLGLLMEGKADEKIFHDASIMDNGIGEHVESKLEDFEGVM